MARTPSIPAPVFSFDDAATAVVRLRTTRARAQDPDLDFYPVSADDDDDIDAAVAYLMAHTRVPASVLAEEIPDRALLVEYQRQRDAALHRSRLRALLNTGHMLAVPATSYGRLLGLPTRYAVYKRRIRLADGQHGPAREDHSHVSAWLAARHSALTEVAEALVDNREELLATLRDSGQREELADAVDQAGTRLSTRPSLTLASAIAYAMFLLRPAGPARQPADETMVTALKLGSTLRDEFLAARMRDSAPT